MSQRILQSDLTNLATTINEALNLPTEPYIDGVPQPGVYYIEMAYGAFALYRMSKIPGSTGVTPIFGFSSKRELYNKMIAFMVGLGASEERKE